LTLNVPSGMGRLARFAGKPWRDQFRSFAHRWLRVFPGIPLPFHLPFGAWWLLRNDHIGSALLEDAFENTEHRFVEKLLQPGMTVLDIGANQGYYTMLASRRVGREGKVIAFEPSPREFGRLKWHLWLNRCNNVEPFAFALGAEAGKGELHVVQGTESGCNSLRPPKVAQPVAPLTVSVQRLDDFLKDRGFPQVDFIKLDVEGAELSVLQGAQELLLRRPRPKILAEIEDIRTRQWGYDANRIVRYLTELGYEWFKLRADGTTQKISADRETYDGNFVAVPRERT